MKRLRLSDRSQGFECEPKPYEKIADTLEGKSPESQAIVLHNLFESSLRSLRITASSALK